VGKTGRLVRRERNLARSGRKGGHVKSPIADVERGENRKGTKRRPRGGRGVEVVYEGPEGQKFPAGETSTTEEGAETRPKDKGGIRKWGKKKKKKPRTKTRGRKKNTNTGCRANPTEPGHGRKKKKKKRNQV